MREKFHGFHLKKTFAGIASSLLKVLKKAILLKIHWENFSVSSKIRENRIFLQLIFCRLQYIITIISIVCVLPIGGSKVGLLPTPNFDHQQQQQPLAAAPAGAPPMMGMPPQAMVQQMYAAAAAQYMGMLQQQQQQQPHVMPAPTDVMIDSQSNVIPPAVSTANAHNQRELGPFHWMTPTVAAATTYPAHFAAGLYSNLHMQQLFQPTFQQQGLVPPPQLEGEMGVAGGLFIPPMGPDQQRLMQQRQQLVAAQKQSQAVPIVDPKLVS